MWALETGVERMGGRQEPQVTVLAFWALPGTAPC